MDKVLALLGKDAVLWNAWVSGTQLVLFIALVLKLIPKKEE